MQKTMTYTVDLDAKWLYRVGGISALTLSMGYIIIMALYVPTGAPPSGVEARLIYLARNTTLWWAILSLSVLTDLLFVPVALSLYFALKGINRNAMLLAISCVGLFVVLDLAVTWTNYAALISLSSSYAAATSDAQRAVFVAAANYPSAILASPLLGIYAIVILAVGMLIIGLVMLKGIFNRSTAYLAIVSGVLAIVSVTGPLFISSLGMAIIIASMFTTIWSFFAGYRLYRLG